MTEATKAQLSPNTREALEAALPQGQHTLVFGPGDFDHAGAATPALSDYFNAIGFDRTTEIGEAFERTMSGLAGTAAAIAGTDIKPHMEQFAENACMITIPLEGGSLALDSGQHLDMSDPRAFAAASHGVSPEWFAQDNIPGQGNDMQTWMAHHESDHCNNTSSPYAELLSDEFANGRYAQDLLAGRTQDPELPYFIRTQRAAEHMLFRADERYTGTPLATLAGESPIPAHQQANAFQQMNAARDMVYDSIAQKSDMDLRDESLGTEDVLQARMVYEESKLMLQQDVFDHIPYGRTAVERFVDGAERYGHGLYDVAPENQIHTAPDIPTFGAGQGLVFDLTQNAAAGFSL